MNNLCISIAPAVRKKHAPKQWPTECFIELVQRLHKIIPQVNFLIFGAEEERDVCEQVCAASTTTIAIVGHPLEIILAIIAYSKIMICNDAFLMHGAASVGVPVLALFNPTDPETLLPPNNAIALKTKKIFSPYYGREPLSREQWADIDAETVSKCTCEILNLRKKESV